MTDRYALISGGVVRNVCLWNGDVHTWRPEPEYTAIQAPDNVAIGWTYDGTTWGEPVPVPPPVPETISDRQFFQALANLGIITEAEAIAAVATGTLPALLDGLVEAIPDPAARFDARMKLCGAVEFSRSQPLVAALGSSFGWSPDQIDDLWRAAGSL